MSFSVVHACIADQILFAKLDGKDSVSPIVASSKACTYTQEDCTTAIDSQRVGQSVIVDVMYLSIDDSHVVERK